MPQMQLFTPTEKAPVQIIPLPAHNTERIMPKSRQDLVALVWPDGGNKPPGIVIHEDAGHGWLQVPHSLISKLGISKQITGYSYRDIHYAYLEEDCDLSTFVLALKLPENQLMKDFWEVVTREYKDHSPIRNKKSYC
jgi:hypothetical protein